MEEGKVAKTGQAVKPQDGGPAFPGCLGNIPPGHFASAPVGMPLRAWFAGHAPECPQFYWRELGGYTAATEAKWRVEYADAMIAELEK